MPDRKLPLFFNTDEAPSSLKWTLSVTETKGRVYGSSYEVHHVIFFKRMMAGPDLNKEEAVRDLFFATVTASRQDLTGQAALYSELSRYTTGVLKLILYCYK